jgi:hypothetical protein
VRPFLQPINNIRHVPQSSLIETGNEHGTALPSGSVRNFQQKKAMIRKNSIVSASELKGLLEGNQDVLKQLVHVVIQQTLEAEMDAAPGASKEERTGAVWATAAAIMAEH